MSKEASPLPLSAILNGITNDHLKELDELIDKKRKELTELKDCRAMVCRKLGIKAPPKFKRVKKEAGGIDSKELRLTAAKVLSYTGTKVRTDSLARECKVTEQDINKLLNNHPWFELEHSPAGTFARLTSVGRTAAGK